MLFSPVPFYNPISHPTPPQRTCIYKLLSIIRLAFSPTPISLISFRSDCLCLFLLQAPHRSLHHGLFPKLSFHFLSSCFSHFSRSSLLQCSIFFIAWYSISLFFASTSRPLLPFSTLSRQPGILLVITGRPVAAASRRTLLMPS